MEPMISLECKSCGGQMQVNAAADSLVCPYCGNQYAFRLPGTAAPAGSPPVRRKPLAPRPKEVTVRLKGQNLEISWRWFSPKYVGLAFFCVAWDAFLCFWYSMALGMYANHNGPGLFFILFPIAHVAVGVGLTYSTLAGLLNRSTLRVDRKFFTVQHDPLIWTGEYKLAIDELAQFYCEAKTALDESHTRTFKLCAMMKDGRKLEILQNLESPDVGVFIEQQLESWLKIPDLPMAGEVAF